MKRPRHLLALSLVLLAGCGGLGTVYPASQADTRPTVTTETIDIKLTDGSVNTLSRTAGTDFGSFVEGRGSIAGGIRTAHVSASDATYAALVHTEAATRLTEPFIGRTTQSVPPMSGAATLEGDYLGRIDGPRSYLIEGEARLRVRFGDETVSGQITDRTLELGSFIFQLGYDLELTEARLRSDGSFGGRVRAIRSPGSSGLPQRPDRPRYEGLIGGDAGSEAVGLIRYGDETGVFAAGHPDPDG